MRKGNSQMALQEEVECAVIVTGDGRQRVVGVPVIISLNCPDTKRTGELRHNGQPIQIRDEINSEPNGVLRIDARIKGAIVDGQAVNIGDQQMRLSVDVVRFIERTKAIRPGRTRIVRIEHASGKASGVVTFNRFQQIVKAAKKFLRPLVF